MSDRTQGPAPSTGFTNESLRLCVLLYEGGLQVKRLDALKIRLLRIVSVNASVDIHCT